ncbi:hypothetical protein ACIRBX_33650 [Kitasatospora sp. NPDC096147]|uniref:hypothetical protein n=1 Tax=Kitasatospora sp. NPDC096147 TaxID=3364093 RepID=UPI00380561E7
MSKNPALRRAVTAGLAVALVVAAAAGCAGEADEAKAGPAGTATAGAAETGKAALSETPKAPPVFGAAGYLGLTPGMAKEAALAGGALEPAPVSLLEGCTDFTFKGGPAPDPARMAAEAAVDSTYKDLAAKADAPKSEPGSSGTLKPGSSAKEAAENAAKSAASAQKSAEGAKAAADAAMARVKLLEAREARDAVFLTAGKVSFGAEGLRWLSAPAAAKTAEGIGAGSTVAALKEAYGAKGLTEAKGGIHDLPVDGKPDWHYEFTVDAEKVTAVALVNRTMKCA